MYQESIVTFIDILGFSQLVASSRAEEIDRKLRAVTQFATPADNEEFDEFEVETYEPTVIQFSDSVIRVRPLESPANIEYQIGILFHEILDLVHAQGELANEGILIRGGIALGDVHIDGNTVFGPAFVEAYNLESRIANYPRIVIAPNLFAAAKSNRLLKSTNHETEEEIQYIKNLVTVGDDGIAYVDYCRAVQRELDDPYTYPDFLNQHREVILANVSGQENINSITNKYMWLSRYHNSCVDEWTDDALRKCGYEREELIVSVSDLPALQAVEL